MLLIALSLLKNVTWTGEFQKLCKAACQLKSEQLLAQDSRLNLQCCSLAYFDSSRKVWEDVTLHWSEAFFGLTTSDWYQQWIQDAIEFSLRNCCDGAGIWLCFTSASSNKKWRVVCWKWSHLGTRRSSMELASCLVATAWSHLQENTRNT